MRQRVILAARATLLAASVATAWGCERRAGPASVPSDKAAATRPAAVHPTVASLVPSATDVILGAGLGDHLVAVSNWCRANPAAAGYPNVGDYQTTDWERLAQLKPDVMLVFMAENRVPAGMKERVAELKARLVVVKVETVADVLASIAQMGELTGEAAKATEAKGKLESRLAALRGRAGGRATHPRVLIVLGEDGTGVAGPGGFLDEMLRAAGGRNAAEGFNDRYPSVDNEKLKALAPDKVVLLLPGTSAARAEEARAALASRSGLDVAVLTDWFLMQPGIEIADTGEQIERAIYPSAGAGGK